MYLASKVLRPRVESVQNNRSLRIEESRRCGWRFFCRERLLDDREIDSHWNIYHRKCSGYGAEFAAEKDIADIDPRIMNLCYYLLTYLLFLSIETLFWSVGGREQLILQVLAGLSPGMVGIIGLGEILPHAIGQESYHSGAEGAGVRKVFGCCS